MKGSPPLRFLAVVLGGWAAMRTAMVAPPWSTPPADAAAAAPGATPRLLTISTSPAAISPTSAVEPERVDSAAYRPLGPAGRRSRLHPKLGVTAAAPEPTNRASRTPGAPGAPTWPSERERSAEARVSPAREPARRWSLSVWSFVRRGDGTSLAAGGLLGAGQAGARLAYRLNRDPAHPLALSFRFSTPLRGAGAEAAAGLDWQPSRRLPLHILVERRQALARDGRSAFGLVLYGGADDERLGCFRLDAYGQAGIVGTRSRDLFGDGSIRISLPLGGGARAGAGAWAAAQPGLSRLDLGPHAALRLPLPGQAVTLAADWRVRVAGDARPGSGPTLTLATDF